MKAKLILVSFAIIAVMVTFSMAEDDDDSDEKEKKEVGGCGKEKKDGKKVKVTGKFKLLTDPDNDELTDYMKTMGISKKTQKEIRKTKKVLVVIKDDGESHYRIRKVTKKKNVTLSFESGTEFEAEYHDDKMVNNTFTVNKEERTISRVIKMEGFESTWEATFCRGGFNLTMVAKEAEVTLKFERIKKEVTTEKKADNWWEKFKKSFFGRK